MNCIRTACIMVRRSEDWRSRAQAGTGISADMTFKVTTPRVTTEIGAYLHYFNGFIYSAPALRTILHYEALFPWYLKIPAVERDDHEWMINFSCIRRQRNLRVDASLSWLLGQNLDSLNCCFKCRRRGKARRAFSCDWGELLHNYFEINGQFVAGQANYPENADYIPPPAAMHCLMCRREQKLNLRDAYHPSQCGSKSDRGISCPAQAVFGILRPMWDAPYRESRFLSVNFRMSSVLELTFKFTIDTFN